MDRPVFGAGGDGRFVAGVVVRGGCLKFRGAGVDQFVGRSQAQLLAVLADGQNRFGADAAEVEVGQLRVGIAHLFGFEQNLRGHIFKPFVTAQNVFEVDELADLP